MTAPQSFPARLKRRVLTLVLPILFIGLPLGGYVLLTRATGNFHEVTQGVVYRSGQMDSDRLAKHVSQLGIRSILNLRGRNVGKDWYDAEISFCEQAGIQHYDIPLSAGQDVSHKRMEEMVHILKTCPKPLLIHCKEGADRAALGSAFYHLAIEGKSPEEAARELTIWYGHIPMITPNVAAMVRSLWNYARAQGVTEAP